MGRAIRSGSAFECARLNMQVYWRTRMVGRKPEEFSEVDE